VAPFARTLVTAALPYANGDLHLGHLAGAYLPADIFVRTLRLLGRDVLFICGTDEYGVPITKTAEALGISPKELVDRNHISIKESFERLGVTFDNFSQTSRPIHTETSQGFFLDLHRQGLLKQKTTDQFYCPNCKRFLADRFVEGTCPKCGNPGARGDQCEKCGTALNQLELIDAHCATCGAIPETRATEHWFLPLGDWQPRLEAWLGEKTGWKENVLNYCRGWFAQGLEDRAITRDLQWGVPVPLPGHEGKVIYVWFDAPIGYISATREWAAARGDPEGWRLWWQDPSTRLLHFIGKDNIVFHAIMFPAMLMANSEPYVLPDNVPANEFLNLEGNKLSTSRGYAVWLPDYLAKFPADSLRYALARNLPETKDTDFTWEGFQARHNNELGNNFGNLVNRVFAFTHKYFEGKVPEWSEAACTELDRAALDEVAACLDRFVAGIERFEIRAAMEALFDAGKAGNRYFDEAAPFRTRKEDLARCAQSMGVAIQLVRTLTLMLSPVVPFAARKVWGWLGMTSDLERGGWAEGTRPIPAGRQLGRPEILFPRIEDEQIALEIGRLRKLTTG
jgi:methionyl-tRNA synthetase